MKHGFLTHKRRQVPLAFRSAGFGNSASSAGITCDNGAGVVENDLIIIGMASNLVGAVWAAPDGTWTAFGGTTPGRSMLFWKIAGASEPSTYTFTKTGGGSNSRAALSLWSGHDPSTPIADAAMAEPSNSVCPTVTASRDDSALLNLIINVGTNTTTPTAPATTAIIFSSTTTAFKAGAYSEVDIGATGTRTFGAPAVTSFCASIVINKAA